MIDISLMFPIIIILAGITTLQFFYGRKLNLMLMKNIVVLLEETIKPKDQLYTWLGGYIGFKAEYTVDDARIEKIEVTLTLLPRHSILYLPISKFTLRDDRLFIVFRSRYPIRGDVHLIKKGLYKFGKGIDNPIEYFSESISLDETNYEIFFKRKDDKNKLLKLVSDLPIKKIKHISITPSTRVVYAFLKPDKEAIEKIIPKMFEMVREFHK